MRSRAGPDQRDVLLACDLRKMAPSYFPWSWILREPVGHLHMRSWAADLSLKGRSAFPDFCGRATEARQKGKTLREFEKEWRGGARGKKLLGPWRSFFREMSEKFGAADPKARVKWATFPT